MLGRKTHKSRPEYGVLPGGKYGYHFIPVFDGKIDSCPDAFTDPIFLHGQHLVRPTRKLVTVHQQIFGINGMGKHFVQSVGNRDYPVITGLTLLYGVILVIANLMVDISYAWLDPRIRYD